MLYCPTFFFFFSFFHIMKVSLCLFKCVRIQLENCKILIWVFIYQESRVNIIARRLMCSVYRSKFICVQANFVQIGTGFYKNVCGT